jgi:hypothetical protein
MEKARLWRAFRNSASDGAKLIGGTLPGSPILRQLIGELLAFAQIRHAGAFNRADMDEHVLAAIIGLDKSKAFLHVKPFHSSDAHTMSLRLTSVYQAPFAGQFVDV